MDPYNPADGGIDPDREAMEADLTPAPPDPDFAPLSPEDEAAFQRWLERYDSRFRIEDEYFKTLRAAAGVTAPF